MIQSTRTSPVTLDLNMIVERLMENYRLLPPILAVFVLLSILYIGLAPQTYTATAIVGPADNPLGDLQGGGLGGIGAVTARLSGTSLNPQTVFSRYTQLLTSNRLLSTLIKKDHILPIVFPKLWDAQNNRWKPHHPNFIVAFLKDMLHRPTKQGPNLDDLRIVIERDMQIQALQPASSSLLSSSTFQRVTFSYDDQLMAERLLNLILNEADQIIREDKKNDVTARVERLKASLADVTMTEERQALIDALSNQEQLLVMLEADKRYASSIIDTPYAPSIPTWPAPGLLLMIATALSAMIWAGLVMVLPRDSRLLQYFRQRYADIIAQWYERAANSVSDWRHRRV